MAFYTVVTDIGRSKLASAAANSETLNIIEMALGDGAGSAVTPPDGYETALVNEVYRAALNSLIDNGSRFTADMVVSSNVGGFTVREMGLFDADGDLIAYANTPAIEKPTDLSGVVVDFRPTMTVELEIPGSVTVIVDPAIISASQQWVDGSYLAKSRNLSDLSDVDAALVNLKRGVATGIASLDETGKVPQEQMPIQRLSEVFTVADETAMLALDAQKGDVAIRTDENKTYILSEDGADTLANWIELQSNTIVISVAGKTGTVTLDKTDVGLDNVDNTSDANKPVSTAQANAISTAKGEANTYTDDKIGSLTKASVGLDNVDNTADANKPVSTAQAVAISAAQSAVQDNLNAHAASSSAHGATPAPTINQIIRRDAAGRAQVEAPNAAKDIANKNYVDSRTNNLSVELKPISISFDSANTEFWIGNPPPSRIRYIEVKNATYLRVKFKERGFHPFTSWTTKVSKSQSNAGYLSCYFRFYPADWQYMYETDGEIYAAFDAYNVLGLT